MARKNIMPDFVVTIDPNKPVEYLKGTGFENIPLICTIQSNQEILALHKANKIWVNSQDFIKYFFTITESLQSDYNTGGSVATAAFAICAMLEFKRIIIIGQDLAYDGDITHADGEISGDNRRKMELGMWMELMEKR